MQVAVISDVHANKVALEAVSDDMPAVDAIVSAGDVVGYNPWPGFCVEWHREREVPTVMGNHDYAVAHDTYRGFNEIAATSGRYARESITTEQIEWLADLPDEAVLFGGRLKVVHGHPENLDQYVFPDEFGPELLGSEDVLVLGHTHVQHHEQYEEGIVLNPGSVGQPRDGDPGAAYAVLDLDAMTVEERRVEYDVSRVIDAVRERDLPPRIGRRLGCGQ